MFTFGDGERLIGTVVGIGFVATECCEKRRRADWGVGKDRRERQKCASAKKRKSETEADVLFGLIKLRYTVLFACCARHNAEREKRGEYKFHR